MKFLLVALLLCGVAIAYRHAARSHSKTVVNGVMDLNVAKLMAILKLGVRPKLMLIKNT